MEEVAPDSGIKGYILTSRNAGFVDAVIKESLKNAGWPEDIVDMALKETRLSSLASETRSPAKKEKTKDKKTEQKEMQESNVSLRANETMLLKADDNPDALFTKPDIEKKPVEEIKKVESKKEKKGFSLLSIVALLLSPVPFIGLGVSMAAIESIRKNKLSGLFLAIIALLINIAVICFIAFVLYQIFTLNTEQLTGFSKYAVDTFGLL